MMKSHTALAAFAAVLLAAGCGEPQVSRSGASGASGASGTSETDLAGDAHGGVFGSDDPWIGVPTCAEETQYVYVIDSAGALRRFDPPNLAFRNIGPVQCAGSPFSMAVDRNAVAWVLFTNGSLARVDTRTGQCRETSFRSGQRGFAATFGMGFAADGDGSKAERLFVSGRGLARLDTQSLTLAPIGGYGALRGDAELTGTGDGRLFGVFETADAAWVIAELDKKTARPLSQVPQPAIHVEPTGTRTFAFAFWGGDFYVFVGPGDFSDVFRYRPADGTTTKVATVDFEIVGAGVSTCAPTSSPN